MFWDNDGQLPADDPRLEAPVEAIGEAVADVQDQISSGEISEEEPISQRLAQRIRDRMRALPKIEGVRWTARVVTPKKHTESEHGTDLAIWVDIDLTGGARAPAYRARKTVLVQAKRSDRLDKEMPKLREQVVKMKAVTDAAGVFVVGQREMWAADADDVGDDATAARLITSRRSIPEFFRAVFRCQVGDHRWQSPEELRDTLEATTYLLVKGTHR